MRNDKFLSSIVEKGDGLEGFGTNEPIGDWFDWFSSTGSAVITMSILFALAWMCV